MDQELGDPDRCQVGEGQAGDNKRVRLGIIGIGDEVCVFMDHTYGNWISGSEGSGPLRAPLMKRAKRALACARRQALRRS
jgi:hypothetical protein